MYTDKQVETIIKRIISKNTMVEAQHEADKIADEFDLDISSFSKQEEPEDVEFTEGEDEDDDSFDERDHFNY